MRLRRFLRYLLILLLAGILVGTAAALLEIPASTVQMMIILVCIIWLAAMLLYYGFVMAPYRKRVLQQNADMDSGKSNQALADMEAMQEEPMVKKSRYLTQCCDINRSAAYCRMEQYGQALDILRAMPEKNLRDRTLLVHHLNTCICLFYLGMNEEALDYYREQEKLFRDYKRDRTYGGHLALLQGWVAAAQGDVPGAREVLEKTEGTFQSVSLQEGHEKLREYLDTL